MLKQTQSNRYHFTVVRELDLAYHHVSGKVEVKEDEEEEEEEEEEEIWRRTRKI